MPRNPDHDQAGRHNVADGIRRAAADLCLAARQLQWWMDDPAYRPKMLTVQARADLADVRDRLTALLGDEPKET